MNKPKEPLVLFAAVALALAWSRVGAYDGFTWALETAPIFIGLPVLFATYREFPLSLLVYRLLFLHALVLMLGGHYTYARVPLGFWMEELFHFSRNNYDRIGHFTQGFVPAILARELLLRLTPLKRGKGLAFLVLSVCLAFSASYELIEWGTALAEGPAATDFLGTQGDPWDTQWDMFMALVGASSALVLLSRRHDAALSPLGA